MGLSSLSGTHSDTTRPPKLVMHTSMPLLFLRVNKAVFLPLITESNCVGLSPDTVVAGCCCPDVHADSIAAAMPNPIKDVFRFFIISSFSYVF